MFIRVHVDSDWLQLEARLLNAPAWMPKIIKKRMDGLNPIIVERMKSVVFKHKYTEALTNSIQGVVEEKQDSVTLTVNPIAMRGSWDAGALLEMGSRPHAAPWAPIAAWAKFRGLPAFPVWYKIKTEGVNAHPFLDTTMRESEGIIEWTTLQMMHDTANYIGGGGEA